MKRRILYVVTSLDFGGAEALVAQLATQFSRKGWKVGVVSMIPPRAYQETLEDAGVTVYSLGLQRGKPDPRGIMRLAAVYKAFRPDVVHAHMVHANILSRIARLIAPVPVLICTAHNINEGGRYLYYAYQLTDFLAEFTTNVSEKAVERYLDLGAIRRRKGGYIPNGVDLTRYVQDSAIRSRARQDLGLDDEFVWLTVGRLTRQKDYPNLLEAVARVPTGSRVLIVGDGELAEAIRGYTGDLGLSNRVTFLGIRSDVNELMCAADGFVLSSAWEGLPMVLLEAAAACLPAVATDVGGVAEIVQPGLGVLVPPNDPEGLAKGMIAMESLDSGEKNAMGLRARERAMGVFDMTRVADQWETLFERAIVNSDYKRRRLASRGQLSTEPTDRSRN